MERKLSNNAMSQITTDWLGGFVKQDILDKTSEGRTPTKGNGQYKPYATEAYIKYKQRKSPHYSGEKVNLRFTGGVAGIAQTSMGKIPNGASLVWNRNGDTLIKHDEALEGMPERKIIPHNSHEIPEAWKEQLILEITNAFK